MSHLCFLFNLWKFGFISWLEDTPCSELPVAKKGIRGFFAGIHASELMRLLPMMVGETTFAFNCLGISSLSNILDVFISICLLESGGDKIDWSNFGFNVQVGEYFLGTSVTTSCSHSWAMQAEFMSSPDVGSCCRVSSSKTTKSICEFVCPCLATSKESGRVAFGSNVVSFSFKGNDLEF